MQAALHWSMLACRFARIPTCIAPEDHIQIHDLLYSFIGTPHALWHQAEVANAGWSETLLEYCNLHFVGKREGQECGHHSGADKATHD